MVGRNIAIGGMTGGAGHVGMVTQGFGGIYTAPEIIVAGIVTLHFAVKEWILDLADKIKPLRFGWKCTKRMRATFDDPTEDGYIELSDSEYDRLADAVMLIAGSSIDSILRTYIEWDISSIPDGAEITKVMLKYHRLYSYVDCHVHAMALQPSIVSDENLYNDIGNGAVYADPDGFPESGGNNQVDLGEGAISDLQTQLSSGWFAIGIQADDEYTTTNTVLLSKEHESANPKPTLYVKYRVH